MVKKEKVLFLDFDGPLFSDRMVKFHPDNTYNNKGVTHIRELVREMSPLVANSVDYAHMDPASVNMLNRLQDQYGFLTVISSSWKHFLSKAGICDLFNINDLLLPLHDSWVTPKGKAGNRLGDIHDWFEENGGIDKYDWIAIDDPISGGNIADQYIVEGYLGEDTFKRCIIVDPEVGLTTHDYKDICRIWNSTKTS